MAAVEGPSKGVIYLGAILADRIGVLWTRTPDARWFGRTVLASVLSGHTGHRPTTEPASRPATL